MVLVVAGGFVAMRHQQATVQELVEVRNPNLLQSIALEQQVKAIHAGAYRFLAWTSAGYPSSRTAELAANISAALPQARAAADAMARRPALSKTERASAARLVLAVRQFTEHIPPVLELAEVDQSVATTMMVRAEASFASLSTEIDALRAAQTVAMTTVAREASDSFTRAIALGTLVVATCILLGAMVTWAVRKIMLEKEKAQAETLQAHAEKLQAEQNLVESLRVSERFLEARVTQRTAELSTTIEHLKRTQADLVQAEKLASLGALVAGVAHELNTPIGNALVMATSLEAAASEFDVLLETSALRRSDLSNFVQSSKSMAEMVTRSCQRAATLISSFKQIAVDQASEQRRVFQLDTLIQDNIAALWPSLKQASWGIETEIAPEIVCDSYPGPLGQVIINLIQNVALHAFDAEQAGKLWIRATLQDTSVQISFTDNGKGMTPEVLAHSFDPFYTTRLGQGGSGLGLAIARNIVTGVLGGSIQATSTPGQGACFTLTLPVCAPHGVLTYDL